MPYAISAKIGCGSWAPKLTPPEAVGFSAIAIWSYGQPWLVNWNLSMISVLREGEGNSSK